MKKTIQILLIIVLSTLSCQCANNKVNRGDQATITTRDWPECGRVSSRSNSVSWGLELPLERVWQQGIDGDIRQLVCRGNYLIAATYSLGERSSPSEQLICLDARNGSVIWARTVDVERANGVYISGDLALFLVSVSNDNTDTQKNKIICLEVQTGNNIWELELPDDIGDIQVGNVCLKDGEAFVVAEKGSVYVVDIQEGRITREFNPMPEEYLMSYPWAALGGGKLIMGFFKKDYHRREVCAIDIDSGETCWRRGFDEVIVGYCYCDGQVIVVTTPLLLRKTTVDVLALDVNTGETRWSLHMDDDWTPGSSDDPYQTGYPGVSLSKEEGLMLFTLAGARTTSGQQQSLAYCIDINSGQLCWKNELDMEFERGDGKPGPIIADGIGIIGEMRLTDVTSSRLLFYDMRNGSLMDEKEVGSLYTVIAGGEFLFTAEHFRDKAKDESFYTEVRCYK